MARTSTAGAPATPDTAPPEQPPAAPQRRNWRYVGVQRLFGDLSLLAEPGDVLTADNPPGSPDWWQPTSDPATLTPGEPSGYRRWTPEELRRGALREDPPTTPGWTDPEPARTDDTATEADQ